MTIHSALKAGPDTTLSPSAPSATQHQHTLPIVLPVFGLIALGYCAGRLQLLSDRAGEGLEEFVYVVAIPALIVRSLTNATEPIQSPWSYWAAYFLGVAVTWGTTFLVLMGLFGKNWNKATVAGIAASFSNTVLVGISIILSTFGEPAAAPLFLLVSIHLPLMTTVGTVLMEMAGGERTSIGVAVRRTGAGLVRNPLMIAIVSERSGAPRASHSRASRSLWSRCSVRLLRPPPCSRWA